MRDRKRKRPPRPAPQELSLVLSKQIILVANTEREKGLPVLLACMCVLGGGGWEEGSGRKRREGFFQLVSEDFLDHQWQCRSADKNTEPNIVHIDFSSQLCLFQPCDLARLT